MGHILEVGANTALMHRAKLSSGYQFRLQYVFMYYIFASRTELA